MKTLRTAVVLWTLLPPCVAMAVDLPAPSPSAPSQYGGCQLAQAPQAEPAAQPPPAKPRRKINIEELFDPCHMVDVERATDQAPKDAPSSAQRLELYEDVMEWNRRQGGATPPETWWRWTSPPPGQEYALPSVPEPQGYLLWPAGLALLALTARRRAQRR